VGGARRWLLGVPVLSHRAPVAARSRPRAAAAKLVSRALRGHLERKTLTSSTREPSGQRFFRALLSAGVEPLIADGPASLGPASRSPFMLIFSAGFLCVAHGNHSDPRSRKHPSTRSAQPRNWLGDDRVLPRPGPAHLMLGRHDLISNDVAAGPLPLGPSALRSICSPLSSFPALLVDLPHLGASLGKLSTSPPPADFSACIRTICLRSCWCYSRVLLQRA